MSDMKKYLSVLFFWMISPVFGQQAAHEFSFYAGGGPSLLQYNAGSSFNAGGLAGLGYRYYFSQRWSVGSGAEFEVYHSRISLDRLSGSSDARDAEGSPFEFRYEAQKYQESQRAFYLAVPLNIQFETGHSNTSWYMNMGGKVAYNIQARYQAEIPSLVTTGYYPEWNVELADPAFMGFGQWTDRRSGKNDFTTKTAFLLSGETGIKRHNGFLTYIGAYADYGLNNILKAGERSAVILYMTDTPTRFSYQSVANSLNGDGSPWARKLNLVSFGIKLRFALN